MLKSWGNFHLENNSEKNVLFDEVYENTLCECLASSIVSDIWFGLLHMMLIMLFHFSLIISGTRVDPHVIGLN